MSLKDLLEWLEEWLSLLGPHPYLQAGAIVLVSVVVAKLSDWMICGVASSWARRTKTDIDDRLVRILHRPIFLSVLLIGLALATQRLGLGEGR